jgi:hypothetical protein
MCVFAQSVHLFAVLLQSLYHGINVTKGFVKKYSTATVLHERTILFLWLTEKKKLE